MRREQRERRNAVYRGRGGHRTERDGQSLFAAQGTDIGSREPTWLSGSMSLAGLQLDFPSPCGNMEARPPRQAAIKCARFLAHATESTAWIKIIIFDMFCRAPFSLTRAARNSQAAFMIRFLRQRRIIDVEYYTLWPIQCSTCLRYNVFF